MPCKIEIRKKIEKSVEQLTDSTSAFNLKTANKKANEVNKLFKHKVVEFVSVGDVIDRSIFIPESLIQIYFDSELEIEKQIAARLLKEEEEKERKYVESKKEEWEENREYFENDEPFTRASDANTQDTLFGLDEENKNLEFNITTLNAVSNFLQNIGVEKTFIPSFLNRDGSIIKGAIAAANFIKGTIDISENERTNILNDSSLTDKEKSVKISQFWKKVDSKLPEEASHFWYRLLNKNSELKKALWLSSQTAEKNNELYKTKYGKLQGINTPEDLTEESIGQLIAEAIKRIEEKNANASDYSFFKKFLEWINSVIDIFNSTEQDPFEIAAMKILSSDMSDLMTWEEYSKLNNIVNFADVLTNQSVAPIDYTLIEDIGYISNSNYPDIYKKYGVEDYEGKVIYWFYPYQDERGKGYKISPKFYSQQELDIWVLTNIKEHDQRQKEILNEVRDNQEFFDRLLNKSFRKKSRFLPKTLRKYFEIIDTQNLSPLREWNISKELQQITKKLSEEEKKQLIETNGYTNIAPTLKVLPDLLKKYKKNSIVLSEPIKIDSAKKQEFSILNGIKEMIKLENPSLKSITAEQFVAEAHNWLKTNYLLGFANENLYLSYRTDQTFVYADGLSGFRVATTPEEEAEMRQQDIDIANLTEEEIMNMPVAERQRIAGIVGLTKQNPEVYHNKVSLRFNDMYHLKSGHFSKSPSAWGNLTYFYTGKNKWKDAVLLHEIQNDNIEFLRNYKNEQVDLETSLGRYLQQLNTNLIGNIEQIESGGKRIQKYYEFIQPKQYIKLNNKLHPLLDLPVEQGLNNLKQSLNENIQLYKSDSSNNPETAQDKLDKAYSERRKFIDLQNKVGIKSLLTKEQLAELSYLLKQLNTEEIEADTWNNEDNTYYPDLRVRNLEEKKEEFNKRSSVIVSEINAKLGKMYGKEFPNIALFALTKARTKTQIRNYERRSDILNENVNSLLAVNEININKNLSRNIEFAKKDFIRARNAFVGNNFNEKLVKITQKQYNKLIENYKYNEDLLKKLIDEQAQKDLKKESVDISKLSDAEIIKDITGQFEEPSEIDGTAGRGFKYKNMYLSLASTTKEEAVQEIRDRINPDKQKSAQQYNYDYLKKSALDKKEELEKDYGKIEEEVKQTLEVEMNYFTPLVTELLRRHIDQYGKEVPMYFSGYNITKLTQGNDRTAMIYAGKDEVNIVDKGGFKFNDIEYFIYGNSNGLEYTKREENINELLTKEEYEKVYQQASERRAKEIKYTAAIELGLLEDNVKLSDTTSDKELEEGIKKLNDFKKISKSDPRSKYNYKSNLDVAIELIMRLSNNKPIETGKIYNDMSQISGVKLIWQDKIDGLKNNAGGYLVDLSNYNYDAPILFGLDLNEEKPIKPGVQELFESDSNLANKVYEVLGFIGTKSGSQLDKLKTYLKEEDYRLKTPAPSWITDPTTSVGKMLEAINIPIVKDTVAFLREQNEKIQSLKSNANLLTNDLYKQAGINPVKLLEDESIQIENIQRVRNGEERLPTPELDKLNALKISNRDLYEKIEDLGDKQSKLIRESSNAFEKEVKKFFNSLMEYEQKELGAAVTPQQKQQALQLYSQYLDTIFPDSQVKDIVYHGTDTKKEKFLNLGAGTHFGTKEAAKQRRNKVVLPVLLNINNSVLFKDILDNDVLKAADEFLKENEEYLEYGYRNEESGLLVYLYKQSKIDLDTLWDALYSNRNRMMQILQETIKSNGYKYVNEVEDKGSNSYVVFEPEQIHILGNEQDIEGFKEFVGESTQTVESYRAQEQAELSQRIPNIEDYKVNGKVDKSLITDENDLEIYNEIYDKYDALITPLLEASEETKEQTEVEKAVEELRKEVESIAPVNVPTIKVVEDEEGNIEPVDTKPAQKKISKKTYEDVLAKMKDIVKILGIKVEFTDLGPDIMAKADMFNRLIQFSDDTSSEHNFTEEVLHFVVDILEQKEPQIFNKLMSEIWKYSIYKDVKDAYSNEPKFQTPEGNPDIRLLKKEAVGQLLTAYVLDIEEIKDDKNFIGSIWDTISKVIKSLFYNIPFNKRSEFEELASDILNKNLITPEDAKYIGNSREEFYAKKGSKITSAILANKKKLGKKTDIEYNFSDSKAMYDHFINLNNSTTREISKEINPTTGLEEEVEYYISNGEKRQRVSSIISESNKGLFKNISQDDVAKALREAKMQKGTEVHQVQEDIIRRFIDPATGLLRDTPEPRPENYPFDVKFYNILEDNVEKRLKSYPVGTRFLVETKIINEEFGYGGTMDFLAILPNMDVELLDWKTTDVSYWEGGVKRNRFDISPFNQSYWRSQLSLYSRALQENGVKNIKLARAIPIAVELKQKVLDNKKSKTDPANIYYELVNLNIGDINPKKIKTDEFYLIPVSIAQEVTGVKELDEILDKLIGLKDRVQGTRYKETELYKKKLELDRINSAIREIQGKQQITIFSTLFNENFKRYKTLSTKEFDFLDSLEKGQKFLSKAQEEELHAYFNDVYSAIEFLDTFKNINALVVSLSENGLLEEYTDQVKQNILKLSANAGAIKNLIEDRSTEIVDKLAIVYDIENFSSADIVGSYGITNFVSLLHRTEKSIALTGRILNVIKYLEAEEKKKYFDRENGEFAKTFKGVIQWAKKNKSSMKNAYSKLFNKEKEKLISKYSDKFKEELEAKNEEFSKILEELKQNAVAMGYKGADYTNKINEYFDYTKQWLEDSFDLKKYEEDFIKAFNSQKEWIDKQTWNEDFLLNEEFKGKKIREWVENHNIFTSPKALSSSNFLLYDSMKDKWLSDEYKELQKDSNKELLAAYNLFISLNERARKSGMLDNMYSYRTFKPLIYEPTLGKTTLTAIQKLGLEGWYALKYISDFIKKRIGFVLDDSVYDTNYDPLTKRAIKKIPVRFKQVDEKNMDYVSDDLFSLYQRWASHIINYELLSNFENRFKMVQLIESNRASELAIDSKGNLSKEKDVNGMTIKNKNKVVTKDRNNQTDIDLNKYINNYLYSTNLDSKPEYYKLGISLMDYAQSLFLNLNFSSPILNVVGGSILSRLNQGNWFSKNDLTSIALPLVLGTINKKLSPFGDDLIGKASYLITEFNTNITSEYDSPDLNFYKTKGKQSAKKLLNAPLTIGDHLMQNALSIAVFLNTAVVDGELVNINDYVGAKYLPTVYNTQLSYKERNKASNKMKDEINKMKKTKSLLAITKKNGKSYSIEGFNSSQTTYDLNKLNYGNTIHSFIKQSIGNYDEYDKSLVNINFYFRFVMQMKKWMPRVIGSALNKFEENYELGGGSYGRKRIFFKTLFKAPLVFLQATASSLLQQLPYLNSPNKSFIDYAKEVYKQKQIESRDKGKELKTTEAEFVKLYTEGFKNQINELTIIATTLYAMSLIAAAVADDPDKWYWKFISKLAFKLKRDLTFSYDPEQATSLLQNNLFPALGAFTALYSAIIETGKEGKGHIQKLIPGYEEIGQENIDAAKPLSKIIRAIPVARELDYWMSVLDPELPFIHESYLDFMGTEAPKSSF